MPFESIALLTSASFALGSTFLRLGIEESDNYTGSLIVVLTNFTAFALVLFLVDFSRLAPNWYWASFLAAGLASPALSLFLLYRSIHYVGVAVSTALGNMSAIPAAFAAIILLGERPSPTIWAGIFLGALGIYLISGGKQMKGKVRYLYLPLLAATPFALAFNLRKIGFKGTDSFVFGGFLQAAAAAVAAPPLLSIMNRGKSFRFTRRSSGFFVLAGLCQAVGQFILMYAFLWGRVSLVAPMIATIPLFALVYNPLILGGKERLTRGIVAGILLVTGGTALVILNG